MNARLLVFSLNLGMSFAILVLYVSSILAITFVVLLITASVVASSTKDLSILREDKNLLLIMAMFAIFVFFSATFAATPYS
ncbi:MAG: hypothetical protein ACREBS_05895, partial [Nitrososphaerales archaeon]